MSAGRTPPTVPVSPPVAADPGPGTLGSVGARIACGAIAAIAAGRMLVSTAPIGWFDVDPVLDPTPWAGILPSQVLCCDAAVLALSALALACMRRSLDRIGIAVVLLALLPVVAVVVHAWGGGPDASDDLWRGVDWVSAAVGAATLASCARADAAAGGLRPLLAAVLLGGLAPVLVRSGIQLAVEHPETVAYYRAHKAEVLAARGWAPDGAQAAMYERRLLQLEATGWFGLSNVLSGVAAAGAVALGGLAAGAWRRVESGTSLVLALAAGACAAVVAINGSKGAVGALAAGAALAAFALVRAGRVGASLRSRGASLALALVGCVVLLVVVRGLVGDHLVERSLLFRWQYLCGAMRAFASAPLAGTGPAGFAEAYLALRPPTAPEEVASAHAAWADWLAALGVAGAAWIILLAGAVAGAGRSVFGGTDSGGAVGEAGNGFGVLAFVPSALVGGVALLAIAPEGESLDPVGVATRLGGAGLAAILAFAVFAAGRSAPRALGISLGAAGIVVAMHACVEMTLWQPGSVAWVACALAVAAVRPGAASDEGGDRHGPRRAASGPRAVAWAHALGPSLLLVAVSALVVVAGVLPAAGAERRVASAAVPLAEVGLARMQGAALAGPPVDERRMAAARALAWTDDTGASWTRRPIVLGAAIDQAALAAMTQPARTPDAIAFTDAVLARCATSRTLAAAAAFDDALLARAPAGSPERTAAAERLARHAAALVSIDPRNVRAWIRTCDARLALGDPAGARDAAQRALDADASYALDPARRLPAAEFDRLNAIAR